MTEVIVGQRWVHKNNGQIVKVVQIGGGIRPRILVERTTDSPVGIPNQNWVTSRSSLNAEFRLEKVG
jgi:hypothetical protein